MKTYEQPEGRKLIELQNFKKDNNECVRVCAQDRVREMVSTNVGMCVCVSERERERDIKQEGH